MKIYTRTGDSGKTGLFGGPRVAKDDCRIEAYGTVDELNAVLGCVRGEIESALKLAPQSVGPLESLDQQVTLIQHELFSVGAELASPQPDQYDLRVIGPVHVERVEKWIDEAERGLEPLKQFILPAGGTLTSQLHLARAVCRRAERRVITLSDTLDSGEEEISVNLVIYLNRLSDWLFVASRHVNMLLGRPDCPWVKPSKNGG